MKKATKSGAKTLRDGLASDSGKCLIGPGVFDGISTRVASTVGFDFLYLAGSGATGSYLAEPDLSVMTQTEFAKIGEMMRCGQLKGKDVVDLEHFIERIRSAVEARMDPDFVIIARTDARQAGAFGGEYAGREAFQEGVRRLKAALEAGADMAFMESPRTTEECATLVKELAPRPVLINVLPHGLTPNLNTADCQRLGFAAAIYPCTGFIPAMIAMQKSYGALKNSGSDLMYCKGQSISDFFDQVGLREAWEFDDRVEKYSKEKADSTEEK
ncbi:Phosphoenolpyruvate/pyruvate domain-containing protein [Zopfia rhizophila CBS 207.26]|uniref:Phosphoenolpyruvate/pyruvate domain-containing protein n=1 Tax=Zopfia rhizophila CBS 207.26 TaxID=1314779 RepID=A0A6A6DKQ5_9PEZI|nr:Phosphoenolpyruvate/pyruvate domain-containing protein [Zopfia rhizophila CBS 207.26]